MSDPIQWEVLPNEHIEEDETVSADELYRIVMQGYAELEAHNQGELKLDATEVDESGNHRVFYPSANPNPMTSKSGASDRPTRERPA